MSVANALQSMDYGVAPEASSAAEAWLKKHDGGFGLFIGGAWSDTQKHFDSINPATGKKLGRIAEGSAQDVDAAVTAARAAQAGWAKLGGHGRARYLYALARLVQKHARLFAVLETMDNGKPIRESRDIDIPLVARHFYHHAGWAQLIESEFAGYEPLGVVGQVIPWNFPLLMLAWKIAPALAAGNTVVLKPAEDTSLTALLFAEICQEANLPKGVVNIVTGAGETGKAVVEHPGIDKIAFTGSTEVGRIIRAATAGTGKKLTLELGGKSPFIVFDDADLDAAVEGAVDAIWFNQGQVCCAGSRLLVQESVAEKLYAKLRARMENLRVGDPLDKNTDVGAIVSPKQRAQIDGLVKKGVAEGATLYQTKGCPEGCFYPPTLLGNVEPASSVAQVEIFGPVLVAMTFRTPAEAVQLANNTRYGLAASVWSENINVALDLAPKIKAGVVWVNCTNQFDALRRLRRLPRIRLRPRRRPRGHVRVPQAQTRGEIRKSGEAADHSRDVRYRAFADRPHRQALHRRQAGASRQRLQPSRAVPRPGHRSGWSATATARISAMPSKRRPRPKAGPRPAAMPARKSSIIARKTSRPVPRSSPGVCGR